MSLATRCSACGTVFRVVQDQLKVSEGWVRCGRCNEVFNALSGLFDLDRESPPEWEPQQRDEWPQPAPAKHESTNDPDDASEAAPPSDPRLVDRIDEELFGTRASAPDSPGDDADAVPPASDLPAKAPARNPQPSDDAGDADEQDAPEFVRNAERAQRWNQPWVRAVLGVLAIALFAVLGLQFAHHFRDELAARHPDAAPALSAWCEMAGCRIRPPRRIDDVAVESTTLSKAGGAEGYRLGIVLRNHGTTPVAMPSIDLALTDASGQLIARRNLDSRDFAAAPDRLPAGGEASLQTVLAAGATKITGYTVELFYP